MHDEWPSFVAYLISFFVIGTIWVNHHALFVLIDHVDRAMLFYNLLLLFWVCTIPFTTSALAEFLSDGTTNDVRVAVLLYGAVERGHGDRLPADRAAHALQAAGQGTRSIRPPAARR